MARTTPEGRRAFLNQAGKTLLAAVGVAVVPGVLDGASASPDRARGSTASRAVTIRCCASSACNQNCGTGKARYRCTCNGDPSPCTSCQEFTTYCYSYTAPFCP